MFDGFIRDHAHLTPRALAVITPASTLTYAAFNADIDRFGAALAEMSIGRDTNVVSIAMDDPVLTYVLMAALACAGVRDVAAFAVPNAAGLEDCWLAVVADPGFDRDDLAPHLSGYKGLPPNRFAWVDEIPRNAMGKVERTKLRDALLAALGQSPDRTDV